MSALQTPQERAVQIIRLTAAECDGEVCDDYGGCYGIVTRDEQAVIECALRLGLRGAEVDGLGLRGESIVFWPKVGGAS